MKGTLLGNYISNASKKFEGNNKELSIDYGYALASYIFTTSVVADMVRIKLKYGKDPQELTEEEKQEVLKDIMANHIPLYIFSGFNKLIYHSICLVVYATIFKISDINSLVDKFPEDLDKEIRNEIASIIDSFVEKPTLEGNLVKIKLSDFLSDIDHKTYEFFRTLDGYDIFDTNQTIN